MWQIAVYMCGFDEVERGNLFRGEPIRRTDIELLVGKLKNGKSAGNDEVIEKVEVEVLYLEAV